VIKKLTASYSEAVVLLFNKDRINIEDVLDTNFEGALCIFRGFFEHGYSRYRDSGLRTVIIHVSLDKISSHKIHMAGSLIAKLGFELVTSLEKDYLKVGMVPGREIARYMSAKSMGRRYSNIVALYHQSKNAI
jgi:hypothetical protein